MEIENICVCVIQGHLCVYYKHCVCISVFCYFSVGAGQVVYFVSQGRRNRSGRSGKCPTNIWSLAKLIPVTQWTALTFSLVVFTSFEL